ncbi:ABC transporter [Candidatus Epulonipiscioides gigas]|nr:ABC transporter [Epulopiscium sp. SCG-C07WGA-EpuloA2]
MKKEEYEFGAYKNQAQGGPGGGRGPGGPGRGLGAGGEKPKNMKVITAKLLNYISSYKFILLIAIIFAFISAVFTLIGPQFISQITNTISAGMSSTIDMNAIVKIGATIAGIYIVNYVLSIGQGFIIAQIMQRAAQNLRRDISTKINKLPMRYFFKATKGDVLSRVTNDVDTIGRSFSQSIGTFIRAITLFFGAIVMMLITNVILAITALLSTAIGFVFMRIVMKTSQKYFRSQQKTLGQLNGHIEEMFAGHTVVRAYNGEAEAIQIFDQFNDILKTSAYKAQALSGLMMPVMQFIGNLGYVCVCVVGALLATNDIISFGVIVAFMLYIRLFTQPLGQIAQSMQNLQSAAAAAERVFLFLEEDELADEKEKTATIEQVKGEVEFRNVSFGYTPNKTVINNFNFIAKSGQKIAIVGPTGAGKTTVVNLLMRFYEINKGDIFIDGINTKDMKREDVHSQFCMVLQDTWLFIGSLRENLVYTTEGVTQADLERATKAVGLHHFVKTLPEGYDTILNEKINLSEGQKQQITIARAILANKTMLILDEATSSVDTRTEQIIQSAMDNLMKGRTSFVIAHRLSTIKNSDIILVVKEGDIIEQGSHQELLAQKGFYADLYNAQFEN